MTRSVELLGGGVLGFVLGTVFLASPIASSMATSARATWSLDGCPAGVYTLAATAQSVAGGPVYSATMSVQVPRSDVVQVFDNVPPGHYSVSASLRSSDGTVVGWGAQSVTTDGGVATTTALRGRPASQPVKGTAGPRQPLRPPAAPAISAPAITKTASTPVARPAAPTGHAAARQVPGAAGLREMLIAELIRLSNPDSLESGWHQVQLLDFDGDGEVDEVRIEPPNGAVVVWRLVPRRIIQVP